MKRVARIAVLGATLALAGYLVAFAQGSSDLTSVDKIGWWTRRPGAQPTKTAAFEVAAGVQGEESIAALRILIRGTVTKATILLTESDAPLSSVTTPKLKVCPTNAPWLVADGGPYAAAPKPDCSQSIDLTRKVNADMAGVWSGDVTGLLAGARSEVSLMVLPVPDTSTPLPQTYYLKLTARIAAEGTPDVEPAASPTTIRTSPVFTGGGASTPAPTVTGSPAASPAAPTPAPSTTLAPTADTTNVPKRLTISVPKEHKPWSKLFLLVPLALVGGALYTGGQKFWWRTRDVIPS